MAYKAGFKINKALMFCFEIVIRIVISPLNKIVL